MMCGRSAMGRSNIRPSMRSTSESNGRRRTTCAEEVRRTTPRSPGPSSAVSSLPYAISSRSMQRRGPEDNAAITRAVLSGQQSPVRDIVAITAAAAPLAADESAVGSFTERLANKLETAQTTIDDGLAAAKLDQLIEVSHRVAESNHS